MKTLLGKISEIHLRGGPIENSEFEKYQTRVEMYASDCCYGADCGDCDCGGYCIDSDCDSSDCD
jgi:hypothetical protein